MENNAKQNNAQQNIYTLKKQLAEAYDRLDRVQEVLNSIGDSECDSINDHKSWLKTVKKLSLENINSLEKRLVDLSHKPSYNNVDDLISEIWPS